ncbi:hypothetical protein AMS68_002431 [Peltaster fructicola]|uniref:Enoyl reductase (ER) domain-containing protein n=1 Tax=Peltaster fructicola TaxID=286661 RepID=A0A6H0XQA1_9PEZI|nr:hypothetical protein AMS68_002431 [Peltaster fructicola]
MATDEVTQLPRQQRALVATGPGTIALKSAKIPFLEPDQVLVKTAAVALNPSDHKLLDQSTTIGAISGADFAGTIVAIGEDVPAGKWKVGDAVFGVVFGSNPGNPGNGAFAQYVAATADLCIRVPPGVDFTTAASLGMSIMTVGLVFRSLGLDLPKPAEEQDKVVLVYGGATATGTIALQILRLAGYTPITTCSPKNYELVKDRGAEAAFDYNDTDCGEAIRSFTGDSLHYVLDCIGSATTLTLCQGVLADAGGRYTSLEAYPRNLAIRRRHVKHDWVLGWTMFGKEVCLAGAYYRPALPADREFAAHWASLIEEPLESGQIRAHPLQVHYGGLAAVIPRLAQLRGPD